MAPQQLQQQQLQQPVLSPNTMLLQQAIVEGWPAPQMKALLDQMSDEELQQLVELHAASEAAAAAAAAGGPVPVVPGVPGAAASAAAVGQQPGRATGNPANLQGFGSTIGLPSSTSGIVAGLLSGAAGAHTVGLPVQQQQQQAPLPSLPRQQQLLQQQQKQQQQQASGVMSAAAAAGDSGAPGGNPAAAAGLAALFADAGVGAGDGLQPLSDVQLTGDQGMINMDSFTGGESTQARAWIVVGTAGRECVQVKNAAVAIVHVSVLHNVSGSLKLGLDCRGAQCWQPTLALAVSSATGPVNVPCCLHSAPLHPTLTAT
jgi:hypothetical protein